MASLCLAQSDEDPESQPVPATRTDDEDINDEDSDGIDWGDNDDVWLSDTDFQPTEERPQEMLQCLDGEPAESDFFYPSQPLDPTSDEFRFLRILPSYDGTTPVNCTLKIWPIAGAPPYEALSYTWGERSWNEIVAV